MNRGKAKGRHLSKCFPKKSRHPAFPLIFVESAPKFRALSKLTAIYCKTAILLEHGNEIIVEYSVSVNQRYLYASTISATLIPMWFSYLSQF